MKKFDMSADPNEEILHAQIVGRRADDGGGGSRSEGEWQRSSLEKRKTDNCEILKQLNTWKVGRVLLARQVRIIMKELKLKVWETIVNHLG